MPLQTVLLAVGRGDKDRIGALAETVTDIAGPAGATVVLAHVFGDDEDAFADGGSDGGTNDGFTNPFG